MGKSSGGVRSSKANNLDRTVPGLAPGKTLNDVVETLAFQDKSIKQLTTRLNELKNLGIETKYTTTFNDPINELRKEQIEALELQLKILKADYEKTLKFFRRNNK